MVAMYEMTPVPKTGAAVLACSGGASPCYTVEVLKAPDRRRIIPRIALADAGLREITPRESTREASFYEFAK